MFVPVAEQDDQHKALSASQRLKEPQGSSGGLLSQLRAVLGRPTAAVTQQQAPLELGLLILSEDTELQHPSKSIIIYSKIKKLN